MDDERDDSLLLWPFRMIREFRVHMIVTFCVGAVWCAGWARLMERSWSSPRLMLPPLTKLNIREEDPASDADRPDTAPAAHPEHHATPFDRLATLHDAAE